MKSRIVLVTALLLPVVFYAQDKDKKKRSQPGQKTQREQVPAPPKGKDTAPLPPILAPARSAVERRDLLQRFKGRHPLEGFYRLKAMVMPGGGTVRGSLGYMVIGQQYLSLHLYAPGSKPRLANISAAFRKFRIEGGTLIMSSLLGHRNKANGDVSLEPVGLTTQHRFLLTGAVLRLYRGVDEYLEFERIE